MSKELVMEDIDAAAATGLGGGGLGSSSSSAALSNDSPAVNSVWQVPGASELKIGPWNAVIVVAIIGLFGVLILTLGLTYYYRNGHKKKKHNFGIKKSYNLKGKIGFRNPPPVSNPDKGSHYLKKSPSPTGAKSPPGSSPTSAPCSDEYVQRKTMLTQPVNGARSNMTTYAEMNETLSKDLRRCSSTAELTDPNSSLGMLHFSMKYSFDKNALIVTVNKCTNLPAKDAASKTSDPYVKLQLLPEKQHKVKTRVMRKTLNPVYDEDFTFYGIHFNQLSILTLHFVVLSFDRYSRDDVIGEVMLELENHDLSESEHSAITISKEITPRSFKLKSQGRGELLVSLCYQPGSNRISVVVLKARNLPKMDITGLSDPYVKIYLLYNDQRIAKKKTVVKKRTLNPVFNQNFVFELPSMDSETGIKNISLEFLLLDWDRVTKNEIIGRLELGGPNCQGSALHHWNEVISSPRRQIAEWHKLKE